MAIRGIRKLIDRFGPENPVVKECVKKIIYPEDIEGCALEEVIAKLSTIYVLDGVEYFNVQNPFTGVWFSCCKEGEEKTPYVDGLLTVRQLEALVGRQAPLPGGRIKRLVADAIHPEDIHLDLSFPDIVSKVKGISYLYDEGNEVLIFENPFTGKMYLSINGEPAA